jgi:hypothetical protein
VQYYNTALKRSAAYLEKWALRRPREREDSDRMDLKA